MFKRVAMLGAMLRTCLFANPAINKSLNRIMRATQILVTDIRITHALSMDGAANAPPLPNPHPLAVPPLRRMRDTVR